MNSTHDTTSIGNLLAYRLLLNNPPNDEFSIEIGHGLELESKNSIYCFDNGADQNNILRWPLGTSGNPLIFHNEKTFNDFVAQFLSTQSTEDSRFETVCLVLSANGDFAFEFRAPYVTQDPDVTYSLLDEGDLIKEVIKLKRRTPVLRSVLEHLSGYMTEDMITQVQSKPLIKSVLKNLIGNLMIERREFL